MIPKRIHYCWFGRNPLPDLAKKCIASWKKYCPDYEIVEWNEDNFDIESAPLYVRQAYEARKWAFVTDYVRLYAMTEFGGIYMDTDVELVKPLDKFLTHRAFSGFEDEVNIPTGIMACEKGFPLFEEFLHYYDDSLFINNDGSLNIITNVAIMTRICLKHGLIQNGKYQEVDGFVLYPRDVFCPIDHSSYIMRRTRATVAIHWFAASWHTEQQRQKMKEWQEKKRKEMRRYTLTHLHCIAAQKILGMERYLSIRAFLRGEKANK